ncbi:MAG: T9SS type A sorting domain-containing protein [Ignavibacteria bacterium]
MKKLLITVFLIFVVTQFLSAQNKIIFSLTNPRDSVGKFMVDLMVTVQAGQVWNVGAANVRVNFVTSPVNMLTVQADNPAVNANPNISNNPNGGYYPMTTNSVGGGVAIGCNILTLNSSGFYHMQPGTYRICTLRWTRNGGTASTTLTFRVPPEQFPTVVNDSLVGLTYNSGFGVLNPGVVFNSIASTEVPASFALYQNYPNPFNPTTTIKYDVPEATFVTIKVYDITGKLVETLVNMELTPGKYEVMWNAGNYASGVYFYRIETSKFTEVKRMLLIK